MPTKIIMPQLGESVVEGTITKWLVQEGQPVNEMDSLLEVNTDKVDTEIPSPASGQLLKIVVPEGETVRAGTVIAWVGQPDEAVPGDEKPGGSPGVAKAAETAESGAQAAAQAVQESAAVPTLDSTAIKDRTSAAPPKENGPSATPVGVVVPPPGRSRELGFISPIVARMAQEHQIDLTQVTGSGEGGRITKKDVLAFVEQQAAPEPAAWETPGEGDLFRPTEMVFKQQPVPTPPAQTDSQPPAQAAPVPERGEPVSPGAGQVVPLSTMRRKIAEHMVFSERTSPHVTTVMEADLHHMMAHFKANKDAFAQSGVKLTYTPYFVAAAVQALRAVPLVNASWTDEGILIHPHINIGLAVSLGDEGLIVPVLKNADELSLLGLARAVGDLAGRARGHKLQPEDVRDGTFTITNHGISGSLFATPIINQPQCGIMGVGAIQKRVVVIEDETGGDVIAVRPMVYLSLTFDHRILDGASADAFLSQTVQTLENWA